MELSVIQAQLEAYRHNLREGYLTSSDVVLNELDGLRIQAILWGDQQLESIATDLITYGSIQEKITTITRELFSAPPLIPRTIIAQLTHLENELSTRLSTDYPTDLRDTLISCYRKIKSLASVQTRTITFLSELHPQHPLDTLERNARVLTRTIFWAAEAEKKLLLHTIFNAPDSFGKRLVIDRLQNP